MYQSPGSTFSPKQIQDDVSIGSAMDTCRLSVRLDPQLHISLACGIVPNC
jgi:hypothetical protein